MRVLSSLVTLTVLVGVAGCSSSDFQCRVSCDNPHASQGPVNGTLDAKSETACLEAIVDYCDEGCSDTETGCCKTGYSCGEWSN